MRLAVLNRKGGVGKSAIALGLAAGWAQQGRKVLLVDLDPQATATRSTDVEVSGSGGADQVLHGQATEEAKQWAAEPWSLDVLSATQELAAWESDPGRVARELRLGRALDAANGTHDHIVIDCPPALGILAVNALAAATHVLLVTEATGAAVDGLGLACQLIEEVRQHIHGDLQIAGVVLNAVDERERESRHFVAEVRNAFGTRCLEPFVPRRTAVRQAMSAHVPVHHLTSDGARQVSDAYARIASHLEEA
jgi:chromosome partitioning protein